jgi:hypothetical protein
MPGGKGLIVALACLALAGCSSDTGALTLVETKSPVQLLRNEAWSRMPELMLNGAVETTDASTACQDAADDPRGTMRSWTSSTVAQLNNSFAARFDTIAEELADSFEAQGWSVERHEEQGQLTFAIKSNRSVAVIAIDARAKSDDHRASIGIVVSGPCVLTAGADSDEVKALEVQG